jgi:hypothetical protein
MTSFATMLVVLLILCWAQCCLARTLSVGDILEIEEGLVELFSLQNSYGSRCNPLIADCPLGDHMGAIMRLAFHDATGEGGPNGCIDFNEGDNNGLQDIVATLDEFQANYAGVISKADLWVLAANLVVQFATTNADRQMNREFPPTPYTLELPFRYGRNDAASCDDEGLFPHPSFTWAETNAFFGGRFGMTYVEVMAILGGHSLGRCQAANSGFDGGWITMQSSFSNLYYNSMGSVGWRNEDESLVWVGPQETIMLMSDAELLYDTYGSENGYCARFNNFEESRSCPFQEQTYAVFMEFADFDTGNIPFFGNFSLAYQKMTELGYDSSNLAEVGSPLSANAAYPEARSPTHAPTFEPPTAVPTFEPTPIPSGVPTHHPTTSPNRVSANPTRDPTFEPTTKSPSGTNSDSGSSSSSGSAGGVVAGVVVAMVILAGAAVGYYMFGGVEGMKAAARGTKTNSLPPGVETVNPHTQQIYGENPISRQASALTPSAPPPPPPFV